MPYDPKTQFDPGLILEGIGGLGKGIGAGLADMRKRREEAEAQMAGSLFGFNTLKTAGLLSDDEERKFHEGNANQRNAIVMAATPRLVNAMQEKRLAKENYVSPYAQQPVWMNDPQSGESYQAGVYDERGTPHFSPYGGSARGAQTFTPDDATATGLKDAGYTWAQTSTRSGRWINTDASKPDLDASGNPAFTPDGTGYISRGQVKPITDAMRSQRMLYQSQQPQGGPSASPSVAPRPTLQPDPTIMQNPFGGSSSPAPVTTAPSLTPTASSKVRVKRPDGQVGLIPVEQLQSALAAGYSQIQ